MNLTVMNFNRIRDLVSSLGWFGNDQTYVPGPDCLGTLKTLEDEILNEDVVNRNVRISLHVCGAVKKDLIPILSHGKDAKVVATATRVLVSLSLPIEYLFPLEECMVTTKHQNVRKQLASSSLAIKKAFLDVSATLSLVTILREAMIKSEKHHIPLKDEDCNHLKNCLLLLRNILHIPECSGNLDQRSIQMLHELQSVQSKLIWNLFVQGIDGALLLMLNSKYRAHWTVPLALIIALLYRNQSIGKVHRAIELISSASESSEDDEESDGSKNSSTSLSSEVSKNMDTGNDSGCPLTSEISFPLKNKRSNLRQLKYENSKKEPLISDIGTKLEKVQIIDDSICTSKTTQTKALIDRDSKVKIISLKNENCSESSSSSETPYHKKMKGYCSPSDFNANEIVSCCSKADSAVCMRGGSPDMIESKSSDDDIFEETKPVKNFKAVQKLRCMQMNMKMSESDSSNEDIQSKKVKYRTHPPTGRRGKSPRRNNGCTPSICMSSAYELSCSKGRIKYPLWEKRNSVSTLVDISSPTPSDEDIGNLLKEFTLSFLHSGFSHLVLDLKNLLLEGPSLAIDKSLFFWIVSYFLHLATNTNICVDHISDVLSVEIVSYLVFESAIACENMVHSQQSERISQYVTVHLNLLVIALKEVLCTIDLYTRKCTSPKDKALFNELNGKLAGLQDLRNAPLLLFQNCPQTNSLRFLEDVIVLNHQILVIAGRGLDHCLESNKINFLTHMKMFSSMKIVNYYGQVLENFKTNRHFLNDCVFTMLHHLAGDMRSYELLLQPSILKIFSEILKEEMELEQYQEDLIMYILNKFSVQVYQKSLKAENSDRPGPSNASCDSPDNSCISSNLLFPEEDDLFWWYLQFEQDDDPISKISEHIPTSKQDILTKLQLKGYITNEKYKQLEEKMEAAQKKNGEISSNEELERISNFDDDITHLLRALVQAGDRQHIIWLQDVLLEVCYVKLGLNSQLPESIPFHSNKMMLSIPLIPYSEEQQMILQDSTFLQLLQKLGLHLGSSIYQMFPRIPFFWSPDMLFNIATRLGPLKKDKLKFSYDELMVSNPNHNSATAKNIGGPVLPPLSSCFTLSSWLTAVQQSKEIFRAAQMNMMIFKPNS